MSLSPSPAGPSCPLMDSARRGCWATGASQSSQSVVVLTEGANRASRADATVAQTQQSINLARLLPTLPSALHCTGCTALHWLHCTAYIAVTHYLCRSTATKLCPVEPGTLLLPLASPRPLLPPSSLPQPPASTTSTSALALPACFCFGPPSSHARAPLLRRTASAIPASHRSCLAYQGSSCILLVLPSHLSSLLPSHHHLTTDTNALMRIA